MSVALPLSAGGMTASGVEAGDETNQRAVGAFADHDRGRAGVAAAQGRVAAVEPEAALLFLWSVAMQSSDP